MLYVVEGEGAAVEGGEEGAEVAPGAEGDVPPAETVNNLTPL